MQPVPFLATALCWPVALCAAVYHVFWQAPAPTEPEPPPPAAPPLRQPTLSSVTPPPAPYQLRDGHFRTLPTGKRVWIKPALVRRQH